MLKPAILLILAAGALSAATPAVRPHPRLQVDANVLGQIRKLRDAGDPLWLRFSRRLETRPAAGGPAAQANALASYLLANLVTGEPRYFDAAWAIARGRLYKNGSDRSQGVVRLIDLYKGDQHQAAFQGGQFIGQMALMYDWGYAHLTPGERQDLVGWINEAVEFNYLHSKPAHEMFRNDGASFTYGLAAAAYGTLGENPEGAKLMEWFRHNWSEILKALDIMGKGGAAGEGNAYGASPTASSLIRTANLVYYASGEDLFLSHVWFRQRLLYDAFAAYPGWIGGREAPARYPDLPMIEQASIDGDGRRGASWHSGALRPNGLILTRRFKDTPEADIWNWVYRQPPVDHEQDGSDAANELLYYTPPPRLVKPSKLSFFDPSMGFVYLRSDWDSPDATWIAFWAGPHIDTHQHLDQGGFAIFKRRDLAPKTGHYDTTIRSSHGLGWYTRTISSNGLLIGDPSEIFRGFNAGWGCDGKGEGPKNPAPWSPEPLCPPNDGGQRTMAPLSLAARDAAMFEANRDAFDVARVLSFEDDGRAVSVVADLTNAYNNPRYSSAGNKPKVTKVYRRLVYLRALDVLVVADTVVSTNPKFEKKWLIHALDRIEVGGPVETVDAGESVHTGVDEAKIIVDDTDPSDRNQVTCDLRKGYAALLMKTVFPARFRYRKIGGREPADTPHPDIYFPGKNTGHLHRHIKDFWVKDFSEGVIPHHKSVNWAPEAPLEIAAKEYVPVYGPGYGRWRLEVEPSEPSQTDYFLNVLKPATDPKATLPPVRRLETADTFGAEIGGYRVVFPKDTPARPFVERASGPATPAFMPVFARWPGGKSRAIDHPARYNCY